MIYIEDYPFDERYRTAAAFFSDEGWKEVFPAAEWGGAAWFDVSDAVNAFPHLTLDENYRLFCCMTRGHHGHWGQVAAMRRDDPELPKWKDSIPGGGTFELPANAAPPMEAIYRTDHVHGYLDAILCHKLLTDIPCAGNPAVREKLITAAPEELREKWDVFVDIPDWRARVLPPGQGETTTLLYAFSRVQQRFLHGAAGQDKLYLNEYRFYSSAHTAYLTDLLKKKTYPGHIADGGRYFPDHRCCVFDCSAVGIAERASQ